MGHKHIGTRRSSYNPRSHDLVERPRSYNPLGGPRIGLFGEGVIFDPRSQAIKPPAEDNNLLRRPGSPLTGGAKERPPSS